MHTLRILLLAVQLFTHTSQVILLPKIVLVPA